MAALGAALAATGLAIFTTQGVRKTETVKDEAQQGTYRGKLSPLSLQVDDPTHRRYGSDMPVSHTSRGVFGVQRTYMDQVGGSNLRIYGTPQDNSLTKTQ